MGNTNFKTENIEGHNIHGKSPSMPSFVFWDTKPLQPRHPRHELQTQYLSELLSRTILSTIFSHPFCLLASACPQLQDWQPTPLRHLNIQEIRSLRKVYPCWPKRKNLKSYYFISSTPALQWSIKLSLRNLIQGDLEPFPASNILLSEEGLAVSGSMKLALIRS